MLHSKPKLMESARVEIGSMIIEKSFEIDGIGESRDGELYQKIMSIPRRPLAFFVEKFR